VFGKIFEIGGIEGLSKISSCDGSSIRKLLELNQNLCDLLKFYNIENRTDTKIYNKYFNLVSSRFETDQYYKHEKYLQH